MNWTISISLLLVLVLLPNYNASEVIGEVALLFQLTTDEGSRSDFLLSSKDTSTLGITPDDALLETTTSKILNLLFFISSCSLN